LSPHADALRQGEPKPLNSADLTVNIRDLIIQLHRGNGTQAESLVTGVAGCLKEILLSGDDPGSVQMQRAQQTMFAIDEVRMLLANSDFEGAVAAARDAAKEWMPSSRA
jgi:hypothetical protein